MEDLRPSGQKPSLPDEVGVTENLAAVFKLVENTRAALFGVDRNWNFTYINSAAEKLFQRNRKSLINKNIWECFPRLAGSSIGKTYLKAMKSGEHTTIEDFYAPVGHWFNVNIDPHPNGLAIYFSNISVHKQFEEELKESEERFRFFSDTTTEGVAVLDRGLIIDANRSIAQMFGYELTEVIGKSVLEFTLSKNHPKVLQKLTEQTGVLFELEGLRKDGSTFPLEVKGRTSKYFGRRVRVVIIRNLEEKKAAEKELKESEERFKFLSDVATEGVLVRDNYTIVDVNRALVEMFGYSREELIGAPIQKLITAQSQHRIGREMLKGQQDHGQSARLNSKESSGNPPSTSTATFEGPFEGMGIRKDGQTFPFESRSRNMEYLGQTLRVTLIRDLRERKVAEASLQESEERFQILEEASFEGVLIHDKGTIVQANQRLADIFGYTINEIIATPFLELIAPESRSFVEKRVEEGYTGFYEARGLRKDGTVFPFETQGRYIKYNGKRLRVKAIRDITERIQAQEKLEKTQAQLQQSQRMESIGQLAGGIAHDFNNLLTAIIGYSELASIRLAPDTELAEDIAGDIEEILKAAMRAAGLTHQLLAFSRKQILQPKVINLNEQVRDMDNLLQRLIGEDIELVSILEPELHQTLIDPGQFEQVIINLAVNARDAMSGGGKLTIETANVELDARYQTQAGMEIKSGSYVMVAVSDNGSGMDSETKAKIFDPFFTTKEVGKGTGLGLATVYGIVSQSGGHIFVYSEPGIGTSFKIYLPVYSPEFEGKKSLPMAVSTGSVPFEDKQNEMLKGKETILVAEDDEAVRHLIMRALEEFGYHLLVASNGEEALDMLEKHDGPIHLILTDIVMPGLGGRELAAKLEKKGIKIKMICMSGYTDRAVTRNKILPECQNFLQKPFTPTSLLAKVREVINSNPGSGTGGGSKTPVSS